MGEVGERRQAAVAGVAGRWEKLRPASHGRRGAMEEHFPAADGVCRPNLAHASLVRSVQMSARMGLMCERQRQCGYMCERERECEKPMRECVEGDRGMDWIREIQTPLNGF